MDITTDKQNQSLTSKSISAQVELIGSNDFTVSAIYDRHHTRQITRLGAIRFVVAAALFVISLDNLSCRKRGRFGVHLKQIASER